MVAGAVDENRMQPGGDAGLPAEPLASAPRTLRRLLKQIIGVDAGRRDSPREPV
jgi:hypothetical protein